jgi:hypothetical protein
MNDFGPAVHSFFLARLQKWQKNYKLDFVYMKMGKNRAVKQDFIAASRI